MTTIVVFASSLSITSFLIILKAIELKYGKKNLLLNLINKLDKVSHQTILVIKFKSLQIIQSIRYIILVEIKELAQNLLKKTEEKITSEYKKRQDIVMGRKEIINKGSVSFYLKKITENKGSGEKGKIEDSL